MRYSELCVKDSFYKVWDKELEVQGRDYSISMKIPDLMKQFGLKDVDIRLYDRVSFVTADIENYRQIVTDFIETHDWQERLLDDNNQYKVEYLMNHGMDKLEAEKYYDKQKKIARFLNENIDNLTYTHVLGLMISYGRK